LTVKDALWYLWAVYFYELAASCGYI
jgi:hypothetical protein